MTMNALWLFLCLVLISFPARIAQAEETVATAIHVHSDISSGGVPISSIAELAALQNVDAVIMTDLFAEKFEYGFGIFKKTFERGSILKTGPVKYLSQIEKAGALNPGVLMIDGAAVTPFYYWTGSLRKGPLVLNNRAKDLLVLGLGDPLKYQFMPAIQNGRLDFDIYKGDLYAKPYQKFIDDTVNLGGLVFWSHPQAQERISFNNFFLGFDLLLHTPPYADSLLETKNYTGFGVYSSELAQIHTASETTVSPGGVWDRALRQHCRGQRKPVWAIGEVDYNGLEKGIRDLDAILNMVAVPEKSRESVLKSISEGRVYLIIPASHERRLILEEFTVSDSLSGQKAGAGETLKSNGNPKIRLQVKFSDDAAGNLQMQLLRSGSIIERFTKTIPFSLEYEDIGNSEPGKSYYRVVAYSEESPDRLLTNPIFVDRA
jgi:hypothetical protein